jgi:hypothetical protein
MCERIYKILERTERKITNAAEIVDRISVQKSQLCGNKKSRTHGVRLFCLKMANYVRGGKTPWRAMQKLRVRYGCILLCG